jgi:hypothetical protein
VEHNGKSIRKDTSCSEREDKFGNEGKNIKGKRKKNRKSLAYREKTRTQTITWSLKNEQEILDISNGMSRLYHLSKAPNGLKGQDLCISMTFDEIYFSLSRSHAPRLRIFATTLQLDR